MPSVGGMAEEELIPTGEVARRLGVSTDAIGQWVQKGQLVPAVITPGGRYRWRWSEVQQQLRDQRKSDD
jgi:excisionase family DNA binding protein